MNRVASKASKEILKCVGELRCISCYHRLFEHKIYPLDNLSEWNDLFSFNSVWFAKWNNSDSVVVILDEVGYILQPQIAKKLTQYKIDCDELI